MFNDLMNMETLTTFTGLTGAVIVIVQFTKSLVKKKFGDHFVRIYAFIISLILTLVFAETKFNAQDIVINIINSMMISIASFGGYEMIADPLAQSLRRK